MEGNDQIIEDFNKQYNLKKNFFNLNSEDISAEINAKLKLYNNTTNESLKSDTDVKNMYEKFYEEVLKSWKYYLNKHLEYPKQKMNQDMNQQTLKQGEQISIIKKSRL